MSKDKRLRILLSVFPLIVFILVHIAFYWIVYKHSPLEFNYFKTYLSGYLEIYVFIGLILMAGIINKALLFSCIFFVFAVYGEVQMLLGYWKLGPHPTMEPAMMQIVLYLCGFIIGIVVEALTRAMSNNYKRADRNSN